MKWKKCLPEGKINVIEELFFHLRFILEVFFHIFEEDFRKNGCKFCKILLGKLVLAYIFYKKKFLSVRIFYVSNNTFPSVNNSVEYCVSQSKSQ